MPLGALSPPPKLLSSAKPWPISNKTKPINEGWLQHKHWECQNFPFPLPDRTQNQWWVCSGNKDQVWLLKKHVGNTKEKHNQKSSTESSTQAVVPPSSWNHNNTKCHKPVPSHGKEMETFCESFLIQGFLIWCLWNNYPSASVLITCISLPTLRICKKYIMHGPKPAPNPSSSRMQISQSISSKNTQLACKSKKNNKTKTKNTPPKKHQKIQPPKKYFKNPTKTNAWPSPKLLCRPKSYNYHVFLK